MNQQPNPKKHSPIKGRWVLLAERMHGNGKAATKKEAGNKPLMAPYSISESFTLCVVWANNRAGTYRWFAYRSDAIKWMDKMAWKYHYRDSRLITGIDEVLEESVNSGNMPELKAALARFIEYWNRNAPEKVPRDNS